ncbi:hypothetical protein, partial [Burkholderia pseudomallei]
AIPPPDIHKIRRQVTQSFSKAPRFSAMNLFLSLSIPRATGAARARRFADACRPARLQCRMPETARRSRAGMSSILLPPSA